MAAIAAGPVDSDELAVEHYLQSRHDEASSAQFGGSYRNAFDMIMMVLIVERVGSWPVATREQLRSSSEKAGVIQSSLLR